MIKKLATGVTLALLCLPALAEEPRIGFYAGASAGEATLKDNVAGYKIEASDTGYKLFGGYRFNEYGSLEVSYNDGGTPSDTIAGVTIESDSSAIQASALWQVPISDRWEAYLRLSAIAWEAENSATDGRITLTAENDGTDFGWGIGSSLHFTPRFGLRAEYEGAELDGTDVRVVSVGAMFRF